MCPSLEDFVSLRTLTRCGLIMCPLLEDFVSLQISTRCGSIMCALLEDFVLLQSSTRCGPIMCPSSEDFVLLRALTKYGSNNVLIVERSSVQNKQSLGIIQHGTELLFLIALPYDQYTRKRGGINKNLRKIICPKIKFEVWKL